MSEFKIKVGAARQVKNDLNKTARTMGIIHGDIARVKRSLRWKVQSRDLIDQKLNRLLQDVERNKNTLSSCSSILDQAINTYCDTESSLVESPFQTAIRRFMESPLAYIPLVALSPLTPISLLFFDWKNLPNLLDFMDMESLKEIPNISHSKDILEKKEWGREYLKTDDTTYLKTTDSDDDKNKKIPKGYKEITDADELKKAKKEYDDFEEGKKALDDAETIYEKEISGDYTLWENEGEYKSGNLSNKYDVKFGDVEAHASAAVTTAGVALEAGASVTAFSAEDTLMLGGDMLGVYATGEVEALKAEAKADAQVGIVEVDGKKVLAAHAGASAEAILVDASLKGGAKVLGTDVSANVGVNVGIGAHADIGFQGGKLKFDVGASLGVGVSADFEVDFSGTIDAICGNASNIASATTNAVDNVANAASDAFNFIGGLFGG